MPTANPKFVVTDTHDTYLEGSESTMTAPGPHNLSSTDAGDLVLAPSENIKHGRPVTQARKKRQREKRRAAQRKAEATGIGLRPKERARLIAKFTERGEPVPDYILSLPSQSSEAGTGSTPQSRGLKCSEQSLVRLARALKSLLEKEARLEMLVKEASLRAQRELEFGHGRHQGNF